MTTRRVLIIRTNNTPAGRNDATGSANKRAIRQAQLLTSLSCDARLRGESKRSGPRVRANKDGEMAKEELLQFEGLVIEILPDARYRVQLDAGHMVVVYTAGRMKRNRIKTLAGDRVTVEISPYDLEKGRMIFRHKDERAGSGGRPVQRNHFRRR